MIPRSLLCGIGVWICISAPWNVAADEPTSDFLVGKDELYEMLDEGFSFVRNHLEPGAVGKEAARKYISDWFKDLADETTFGTREEQSFERFIGDLNIGPTLATGINYIYTIRGTNWGTSADRPIVLCTHYDTEPTTPGVYDNGSGVVSLLSTAKYITKFLKGNDYALNYTAIFVTVDFEEMGDVNATDFHEWQSLLGSRVFLDEYLVPNVLDKFNISSEDFQGAFNLETVLNWDDKNQSQYVPEGSENFDPDKERHEQFLALGSKGNYINIIGRLDEAELLEVFNSHWYSSPKSDKFLGIPFAMPFSGSPIHIPSPIFAALKDLFRSDHYRFWSHGPQGRQSLKCVFLTDTAFLRGFMQECYHKPCDNITAVDDDDLEFLSKTTHTLINVFLEATEAGPSSQASGTRNTGNIYGITQLAAVLLVFFVSL